MTCRIKKLADPHGVLAPNLVLTRDDGIHLKSFKSTPPVETTRLTASNAGSAKTLPSRNVTRPRVSGRAAPGMARQAALRIVQRWAVVEKLAGTTVGASDIIQRTAGIRALTGLTAADRAFIVSRERTIGSVSCAWYDARLAGG